MINEGLYLFFNDSVEALDFFGKVAKTIDDLPDEAVLDEAFVQRLYDENIPVGRGLLENAFKTLVDANGKVINWTSMDGKFNGKIYRKNDEEEESSIDWNKIMRYLKIAALGIGCYILGRHQRRYKSIRSKKFGIMGSEGLTDDQIFAINKFIDAQNKVWHDNKLSLVYDRKRK